ncbi:MAG: hypothetical protein GXP05_13415 [Alphaproteobacteria bacterium]|nr:hypothetical protein [Alphaproteobacteria bacterium]
MSTPLTVEQMQRIAADIHQIATEIERQIQMVVDHHRMTAIAEKRIAFNHRQGHSAADMVRAGVDPDTAIDRIAAQSGLPQYCIAANMDSALKRLKQKDKAERNRHVIRLARKGNTNSEIAAQVGICTRTVTRIIGDEFRTPKPLTGS